MSSHRDSINILPSDAIACDGPLMFSEDHFITPDCRLFKRQTNGTTYVELKITTKKQFSWANAKQKLPDGTIADMPNIPGFYSTANKAVIAASLLAYYFKEKLDNVTNMRAVRLDPEMPLHVNNIKWGTLTEQNSSRMQHQRKKVNPENIVQFVYLTKDELKEYSEWGKYYIKNDGTDVVAKYRFNNQLRQVKINISNDGYHNATFHIDNKPKGIRINRLMAHIHHGLDLDDTTKVVDHKDGNILNNHPNNLEVVDHTENVRRGGLSLRLFKVDPSTMKVVETIRCVSEYVETRKELSKKTIQRVCVSGEVYSNFIWLDQSKEGTLFTKDGNDITLTIVAQSITDIAADVQSQIESLCSPLEGNLPSDAIPVSFIGDQEKAVTKRANIDVSILDTISSFDKRGLGNVESRDLLNVRITDHLPCSYVLSYHGKSKSNQLVLCCSSLIIYTRSSENLSLSERKCRICDPTVNREQFDPKIEEGMIPIYEYYSIDPKYSNDTPLMLVKRHDNMVSGILANNGKYSTNNVARIRMSLFGKIKNDTDKWINKAGDYPNRFDFNHRYWSFYGPVNNRLDEEAAIERQWLTSRRMGCSSFQALKAKVLG